MSIEQNKKIVRRFFEELWNERNLATADEIFAPECVTHQLQSGAETTSAPRNAEAIKQHISDWLSAFPDLYFTVERMIAEDDLVMSYATMRGTQTGNWHGVPATGKQISIRMTVAHQIANEKITADWVLVESLGFFQQLKLLPPVEEIMAGAPE